MPDWIWLIVLLCVFVFILWAVGTHIAPALPSPIGRFLIAIVALVIVLALLNYVFDWGVGFSGYHHHRGRP